MDKKTFRTQALRALRTLPPAQARWADRTVIRQLRQRIRQRHAHTILLYLPLKGEVNLLPLIRTLRQEGRTVLVPFMEGESFRLVQYRLPLRRAQYGIYEPNFSRKYQKKQIDIAIVPIVGTDPTFRRIGFGKGMYDRFYSREGHRRIDCTIFVQRVWQYSPTQLTDTWDIHPDELLVGYA